MDELRSLTDDEAVAFVAYLSREAAEASDERDFAEALTAFDVEADPTLGRFVRAGLTTGGGTALPAEESILVARALLEAIDQHPVLGPHAREKARTFTNPEAAVPVISLAVAASLIFLTLSSSVEISYDREHGPRIRYRKKPGPDAAIVKAVLGALAPVMKIAAKLVPGLAVEEVQSAGPTAQ